MTIELCEFIKFVKGKSYSDDTNVYQFQNEDASQSLYVSEKLGDYEGGRKVSQYLTYQIISKDGKNDHTGLLERSMNIPQNIKNTVENYGGKVVSFCKGCGTIVLHGQLANAKGDKCVYCDMYVCKVCKKLRPAIEINNGVCDDCK